jgi:hypothetical protein
MLNMDENTGIFEAVGNVTVWTGLPPVEAIVALPHIINIPEGKNVHPCEEATGALLVLSILAVAGIWVTVA